MIKWLIIDGYNLIHRPGDYRPGNYRNGNGPHDLAGKRRCLIQLLEKTVGILAERITVVFDGRSNGDGRSGERPDELESSVVEVLFSPRSKTADTVIEQLVFQAGAMGGIVVITSDRLERETTEAAGAQTMACSVFCDQLNDVLARIGRELSLPGVKPSPAIPIGNPFAGLVIKNPGN